MENSCCVIASNFWTLFGRLKPNSPKLLGLRWPSTGEKSPGVLEFKTLRESLIEQRVNQRLLVSANTRLHVCDAITSWRQDHCNSLRFTLHKLSISEICRSHRCPTDTNQVKCFSTRISSEMWTFQHYSQSYLIAFRLLSLKFLKIIGVFRNSNRSSQICLFCLILLKLKIP